MKGDRITFMDENDLEVVILGECGWHTKAIAAKTNLTMSQVQYRLTKALVKRLDYRNGLTQNSHVIADWWRKSAGPSIKRDLTTKWRNPRHEKKTKTKRAAKLS